MTEVFQVFASQDVLGEGPVWNPREQALYWVDIERSLYHRLEPSTGRHDLVEVGERIGVLAFRKYGGLVMATERGFAFWDPERKKLERIHDPESDKENTRFNDGAVDRRGRFWAGTLGDSFNNNLYRLDPDLGLHKMETGIDVSNGIGWSPDNRLMYYTDSSPKKIYVYDFDQTTGEIENRRVFVDSTDQAGVPDGMTVDSDGYIWSARWGGWRVNRYDPDGNLESTVEMPVEFPTSVMFGGKDLDLVYVTSASVMVPPEERDNVPLAGNLFSFEPGVKGLEEAFFNG